MLVELKKNENSKLEYEKKHATLTEKYENAKKEQEKQKEDKQITELKNKKREAEDALSQSHRKHSEVAKNIGYYEASLKEIENSRIKYDNIKKEYEVYDYFLKSMSKDGISRSIISNNLSLINKEIKKILSNAVNFDVELESTDDGKAIEIYFKHERNKKRRIELCSGMEKCLSSIALRVALISITTTRAEARSIDRYLYMFILHPARWGDQVLSLVLHYV